MLILSRKTGQQIQVGEMIEVTVLEIRGGRVRLGFSAPRDVGIRRQELGPRGVALDCQPADVESPHLPDFA